MLKLQKVNVHFGDLQILSNVSLEANKDSIVALVGSNGSGKTTLFKTIMAIIRPSSGEICFQGRRINELETNEIVNLGISMIPEGRGIFSNMTVLENLELGAYNRNSRSKMKDTLKWIFELFPILKQRQNQKAGTLSGGEQRMLSIGRGLMADPKLLLLDEITLGLAPKLVTEVFEVVKQINKAGVTIILSEQHVQQALEIADFAYVLETGKITLKGNGRELLRSEEIKKAYLGL